MTICLIGEADPFIAHLLLRFAEESGLQGIRANVGPEVIALARQFHPVVIIVETELPGDIRGWEAVRVLASDPELCHIPVITCSWQPAQATSDRSDAVAGHLQKPDLHYSAFVSALSGPASYPASAKATWILEATGCNKPAPGAGQAAASETRR